MSKSSRNVTQVPRVFSLLRELYRKPLSAPQIIEALPDFYGHLADPDRVVRRDIRCLNDEVGFEIKSINQRYTILYDVLKQYRDLDDQNLAALIFLKQFLAGDFPFEVLDELFHCLLDQFDVEGVNDAVNSQVFRTSINPVVDYRSTGAVLLQLVNMIQEQRQVRFAYVEPPNRSSDLYVVEPLTLEYRERHFYLVGVSLSKHFDEILMFRLDRIDRTTFCCLDTPVSNPQRDIYPFQFRYRVLPQLVKRGVSQRFPRQKIFREFPDGSVEIEACARSQLYALRDLLKYHDLVQVTWPATFVAEFRQKLQSTLRLYD